MYSFKHIIASLLLVSVSLATTNVVSAKSTVSVDSLTSEHTRFFGYASGSMVHGLQSENADIIDSNLNHIVIFKTDFPEFQSDLLEEELGNIVLNGPDRSIRYKAFLTLAYLDHQGEFGDLNVLKRLVHQRDSQSIFLYLNNKVNSDFISSAGVILTNQ